MKYDILQPSGILSPFVRYYWSLEVINPNTIEPYRVIPHGCIELMFFFGDKYREVKNGNLEGYHPQTIITGQQSSYFDLQATGKVGIFSVFFKPHGAKLFFSLPISELKDRSIALSDIAGRDSGQLEDEIMNSKNNCQRVNFVEKFLLKKLLEKEYEDFKRINSVVGRIIKTRGELTLEDMSFEACLSSKQLDRKFSRYVGMSPKQYLKIVRFQNVLKTKELNPEMSLTSLGFECGYYDQAHFIKDFKKITGMTPKSYFQLGDPHSDFF